MLPKIDPTQTNAWAELLKLSENQGSLKKMILNEERNNQLVIELEDFYFDFSKSAVDLPVLSQLLSLARECKLSEGIQAMFDGDAINETEGRSVLHTALRSQDYPEVHQELEKIKNFTSKLISGEITGHTGKKITDVVNIGIGGSDLGPKMVSYALKSHWKGITPHFISNVDAAQLIDELEGLDADTTLFIIASKTFTTQETITNAHTAKEWFIKKGGNEGAISKHFVAVSTNQQAVEAFGIDKENMFVFWDWVGGRYSLWSSIGLSIACAVGFDGFQKLLEGAHAMDKHFKDTDFEKNPIVLSSLIGIWYNNFLGYDSLAILPYDHRLRLLPPYLQQVDMESNGKSISRSGKKLTYESGAIIWGEPGTNGQHAFYQLIHQGTKVIPCEFLAVAHADHTHTDHHDKLLANFFAQSEALLTGKSKDQVMQEIDSTDEVLIHSKVFEGGRPSSSILLKELSPYNLGMLIAFYEHRVFTQGHIWNIFSFDQWGVELGKQLSKPILKEIKEGKAGSHDSSTMGLMEKFQAMRS